MAFNESELIIVIKEIENILDIYKENPLLALLKIKKVLKLYNRLPVYPGLTKSLSKVPLQEVKLESLEKEDEVVVESGKNYFSGWVKDVLEDGSIKLKTLSKINLYKSKTLTKDKIDKIFCVNEKVEIETNQNDEDEIDE